MKRKNKKNAISVYWVGIFSANLYFPFESQGRLKLAVYNMPRYADRKYCRRDNIREITLFKMSVPMGKKKGCKDREATSLSTATVPRNVHRCTNSRKKCVRESIKKVPKQQEQAKEVSNEKGEIWTLTTWCGSAKMCYNNSDDVT